MDDTRERNPGNNSKSSGMEGGDNIGYEQGYKGNSQNVDSGSDFSQNNATNNEAGAYQADDQGMHRLEVFNILDVHISSWLCAKQVKSRQQQCHRGWYTHDSNHCNQLLPCARPWPGL